MKLLWFFNCNQKIEVPLLLLAVSQLEKSYFDTWTIFDNSLPLSLTARQKSKKSMETRHEKIEI